MRPALRLAPLVLAVLPAACALRSTPTRTAGAGDTSAILVAHGSAAATPEARERLARVLSRQTGRRITPVDDARDAGVSALVTRLATKYPAVRGYDRAEDRCAGAADVRLLLAHGADALYRVQLDYDGGARPTRASDPAPSTTRRTMAAVGLAQKGTVREERVRGSIAIASLGATPAARVPIDRRAVDVVPSRVGGGLDVEAALAEAARDLPPPPVPDWAAIAKRLIAQGCPLHALAIHEAHGTGKDVKSGALAAIGRKRKDKGGTQRVARDVEQRFAAAVRAGQLDRATALVAEVESGGHDPEAVARMKETLAGAQDAAAETARAREARWSCPALCRMHMVELCNADRTLWTAHRERFETTPCGTRRPEPFLTECYRQQWLSGTYRDACVKPCEASPEGRERLKGLLNAAGCLRLGAS